MLKQATGIIFLLIGDDKQLPPVEDEGIEDYCNHPAVHYLTNSNRNTLTVKKRSDNTLYNYLKFFGGLDTSLFDVMETKTRVPWTAGGPMELLVDAALPGRIRPY